MQTLTQLSRARRLPVLLTALLTAAVLLVASASSRADLSSRTQSLQQGITSDNTRISAFQSRLHDLQTQLAGYQASLQIQTGLLSRIQGELATNRTRLASLQVQSRSDRQALAAQLVSQYETPAPNLVTVAIQAHGFNDLLESVDQMRSLAHHNAAVLGTVDRDRIATHQATRRLAVAEARQSSVTVAVLTERDQVAALKLGVLEQQSSVAGDRAGKESELRRLRAQQAAAAARAAAALRASEAMYSAGSDSSGGVLPDSGVYGFFPAAGTNYTVNEEPVLAARLNTMAKALGLHLIGISGYRTPQHSVEVGGFANDPHTRGEASDTPGVEGVPEATLNRFGLTRPFPGPAEADHIQLT